MFLRAVSNGAEERTGNAEEKKEEDGNAEEVFTVELHRGPRGLGLVVVDGMVRGHVLRPVCHISTLYAVLLVLVAFFFFFNPTVEGSPLNSVRIEKLSSDTRS